MKSCDCVAYLRDTWNPVSNRTSDRASAKAVAGSESNQPSASAEKPHEEPSNGGSDGAPTGDASEAVKTDGDEAAVAGQDDDGVSRVV